MIPQSPQSEFWPAVTLDASLILGLLAIILSLVLWRLSDSRRILERRRWLFKIVHSGFWGPHVRKQKILWEVEIAMKLVGALFATSSILSTFHYLEISHRLLLPTKPLDYGLFIRLWEAAVAKKVEVVRFSLVACIVLLADWLLSLYIEYFVPGPKTAAIPRFAHAFKIPRRWRDSPAALWENRIAWAIEGSSSAEIQEILKVSLSRGAWRSNWDAWSSCVAAYQEVALLCLGDLEEET